MLGQLLHALFRCAHALGAFEGERAGDHRDGQDAQLLGDLSDHRCPAGAGTATHAGGDEDHVGATEQLGDPLTIFHRGLTTHVRVGTGAEPLGDLAAELQHGLGGDALERLGIGIGADELHPFDAALDHVIDGIAAAATDADDLYDRAA